MPELSQAPVSSWYSEIKEASFWNLSVSAWASSELQPLVTNQSESSSMSKAASSRQALMMKRRHNLSWSVLKGHAPAAKSLNRRSEANVFLALESWCAKIGGIHKIG